MIIANSELRASLPSHIQRALVEELLIIIFLVLLSFYLFFYSLSVPN